MSNGIGKNPLNDISKVYLEQVAAESAVPGKPAERLGAVTGIPKSEQESAAERIRKKTAEKKAALEKKHGMKMDDHPEYPKKKYVDEKLDPVGQEDKDIDNDGDHDKSDKYLLKRRKAIAKAMASTKKSVKEQEERIGGGNLKKMAAKATKRIDADVDGDVDKDDPKEKGMGEYVPSADGKKKVRTKIGESFSNWRGDLTEIMTDEIDSKPIKEKKVNNKIKINPKLGEAVESLGGTIIEMVEVDEIDCIAEEVFQELISEGWDADDVFDAIEEAKVTMGHDTEAPKRERKRDRLMKSVRSRLGNLQYKGYHAARNIKRAAEPTVQRVKTSAKRSVRKAALKVADKLKEEELHERGDFWHPDPEQDRKLGGPGANQRAREDRGSSKPAAKKDYSNSLKPGETYMQYAKRKKAEKSAGLRKEEASMSPQEIRLQKQKARIDQLIAAKRKQQLNKAPKEAPTKAMGEDVEIQEKINLKKSDMGTVVKDFYKSDAPQFKGKSKEKRREMAIAAKLTAERGGKKLGEENIDERTRYAKETGKDYQTGKPSVKGGQEPPAAMKHLQKSFRDSGGMMSSRRKPIQPQGKKKVPGKKGYQGPTPVDKIKGQLARKRAPKPDIGSRFD